MTSKIDLAPLPPFDPISEPSSLSQRWKNWTKRFQTYIAAMNITEDKQKRALLLYQAGEATQEIFETLAGTGEDYATAQEKLDAYFSPKKNVDYQIFQFRQAVQQSGETMDQFVTRLRKLAATCEFHDVSKEIKSAVIQNCQSKRLRRYALREEALTLDNLIAKARSLEASEIQASSMEKSLPSEGVNRVFHKQQAKTVVKRQSKKSVQPSSSTCRQCGLTWPHSTSPCPAKGQVCHKCGKPNHFAKMCRTKDPTRQQQPCHKAQQKKPQQASVNQVSAPFESKSSSDDEYLYVMSQDSHSSKIPTVSVTINETPIDMIIDTGASIDIVDETAYDKVNHNGDITLQLSAKRLFAYGSAEQLNVLGSFDANLAIQNNEKMSTVHVLQGKHGSLLSYTTALDLGILNMQINHVKNTLAYEQLLKQYPALFNGIGKLKGVEVKLHIDSAVSPVAQKARRIPFHIRKKVEQELNNLEQQGIIEKVNGPIPWVSPLVVIPKKNGDVRLCIDMRMANKAIKRERHPAPTVDDLIHTLNGATVFSKLDLRSGYHQLTLAPESRHITTFATHKGLWRYSRLNFGTNSASEIFQKVITEQIHDIPGTLNISDDVIIFGKTQDDHDTALKVVFQKFSEVNLTLNKSKCEFNKTSITFFGFVFSSQGISPDPAKVESIISALPPTTISAVRSFLGMATYCTKFIPNFSDVSEPLRKLTKKNQPFLWTEQQEKSFNTIKELLTSAEVMAYFDPSKDTEVVTDASPSGLSAILMQKTPGKEDRRVVAYASRALTMVERRYSQTEREALAVVWAIEKLHLYLFGSCFKLLTDCKPIELILNNPKSKPPARIERWNLRIQGYNFEVEHKKGSENPSDYLSRHTSLSSGDKQGTMAEEYVNFLVSSAVPKAMTLEEIQQATAVDVTLQCLVHFIQKHAWNELDNLPQNFKDADRAELQLFKRVKDELTVNDQANVILRGSRMVVPKALRERAISIAHEGHQGLVKTKQLLREKIWFPGIDDNVKNAIDKCIACQANSSGSRPDPLQMSPLPPEPWHTVHMDFCGPFPTGEYLFVVIDAYSRFPEVEIVHSTSASAIIPKMDRIFSTHGIPLIIKSDNGPPFTSEEIKKYMEDNGINHCKITPLWPQANSEAENFMKPLNKAIRSVHAEGKTWKKQLYKFLLNYRTTPHCTTGFAPAELLFNRRVRNKLPQLTSSNQSKGQEVKENDDKAKAKMKRYADAKSRAKPSKIAVNDSVLVRQRKQNKLSTPFDPSPFHVVRKKGTMITACRNGKYITRNASHFKVVDMVHQEITDNDDDDDDTLQIREQGTANETRNVVRRSQRMRKTVERFGQNIYDQ